MQNKTSLTAEEMRKKAGYSTKKKYGAEHYRKMGKKGQVSILAKYGPDYYQKLAKKGLAARLAKSKNKDNQDKPTVSLSPQGV